jgi:3-dehydroquinate synthase
MLDGGFGRDTLVVGLGGGVSTDLAGFVAATYMRGVELVNIPTSLLAMVDATVGGKTGINAAGGKNLIGAFHQPRGVIADTSLLATLPEGEWENGLAEMIKHGVIEQRDHLERIAAVAPSIRAADPGVVAEVVAESVAIKVRVVCDDPFEEGRRKVLNFGHTVGHGLEKLSGYRLSHGKAVSVGMVFESEIAVELGVLDQADRDIIVDALEHAGLPTGGMEIDGGRLIEAMGLDKKKKRGKTMMALPCAIGKMVQNHGNWAVEVDSQTILGVARKLA